MAKNVITCINYTTLLIAQKFTRKHFEMKLKNDGQRPNTHMCAKVQKS